MQLPAMLQGDSLKRLAQGLCAGILGTLIVGFTWGGWTTSGTADKNATQRANDAVVAALAPICVDKFTHAADATAQMVALKATDSWNQDTFVEKGGWATFPGSAEPNSDVAVACARLLTTPPAKSASK